MRFKGKVWKFEDDVNTDEIIPARFLNTQDPRELAQHCMEDIDPEFSRKVSKGDIIVAGKNFGCGSSREHAQISIKASGVSCVIAESFARIFYRNSINMGLPILESKEASKKIKDGDILEISIKEGKIKNLTSHQTYSANPFPDFLLKIISSNGLLNYIKR